MRPTSFAAVGRFWHRGMLVVVQFPIADLRQFVENTRRLHTPAWPAPRAGIEFTRAVGQAMLRPKGGLDNWIAEGSFCTARRAMRLDDFQGKMESGVWRWTAGCSFRRLYADGRALVKFEIGYSMSLIRRPAQSAAMAWLRELAKAVLATQIRIPVRATSGNRGGLDPSSLAKAGKTLASMLARVTQPHDYAQDTRSLVVAGLPLVYVEHEAFEAPEAAGKVPKFFSRYFSEGELRGIRVIALNTTEQSSRLSRCMRIMLLRLHAEEQALMATLDAVVTHKVNPTQGSPQWYTLREFLRDSSRFLKSTKGRFPADRGVGDAIRLEDAARPGWREALDQRVHLLGYEWNLNENVLKHAAGILVMPGAHLTIDEPEEVTVNETINIGDGNTINAPVVIARNIQNSFNALAESNLDPQLKELLKQLTRQVAEVGKENQSPEVKSMANDVETLAREAASPKPRRATFQRILDDIKVAATTIGDIAKPVIATVGAILPLLAAI